MPRAQTSPSVSIEGHDRQGLDELWEAAASDPERHIGPADLDGLGWLPAQVPGTVAGLRRATGQAAGDIEAQDWWFRTTFEAPAAGRDEEVVLRLGGLATVADVYLNGVLVLHSESMFASHVLDVGDRLQGTNTLAIAFRALAPVLALQRKPRARWRTRLVADNNVRWFRTMLLGRIPGFAAGPVAVGPWRRIWLERRRQVAVDGLTFRPRIDGEDGLLAVRARVRGIGAPLADTSITLELDGPTGRQALVLTSESDGAVVESFGEIRIPTVERWWPHTHGTPTLYEVRLRIGQADRSIVVDAGRVGFRSVASGPTSDHDIERDGLAIHVNSVPIFARGAVWMPLDIVTLQADRESIRNAIETARSAGMNMLRVPGIGAYEGADFHDLCDELGIMVWQDLMFASMDYPFVDPSFGQVVESEVRDVLDLVAGRPSTTVLCGNSEIEQQVAMLGLDPGLARIPFFDRTVPDIAAEAALDAVYVPSTPFGGDLPMRPDRGVTNYFGLGGYRGPLSDARTSGLRFAGECLAFANMPSEEALAELAPGLPDDGYINHPAWKAGVARDPGAGWDFDDMRDHYLERLFDVDSRALRRGDHDRYLELSRAVTGEIMAYAFGEWRRAGSPCHGGLILWLRDLVGGAGWGLVDHRGRPKAAYHHLRRTLAPRAVSLTDEMTGGVVAHVWNDGHLPLAARLRVACYVDLEIPVGRGEVAVEIPAHGAGQWDVEAVLGQFVDAAWAFQFGPPAQDAIVVSLESAGAPDPGLLSQAFHFPAGRPLTVERADRLGLTATSSEGPGGGIRLVIATTRLAYGVRLHVDGYDPSDDAFSVEPGGQRVIQLRPLDPGRAFAGGSVTALNLAGRVPIAMPVAAS